MSARRKPNATVDVPLARLAAFLDDLLRPADFTDWPQALNGVQCENRSPIRAIAASVDLSRATIEGALAAGANLMLVHHGMFWGGLQPLRGTAYDRARLLIENDVAVYASHLPLDAHAEVGNNVLLARELGLEPSGTFAHVKDIPIAVRGESSVATAKIADRADRFAKRYGGAVRTAGVTRTRMTKRWGICTGAGASSETLEEARVLGLDTLIVGEGPHWTAVDAPEMGIAIIYAGHYATETLGVRALAERAARAFKLPWTFIDSPTGL